MIKIVVCGGIIVTFFGFVFYYIKNKIHLSETSLNRQSQYYDILLDWLDNKQGNRRIDTFLMEYGYKRIGIYGKGTLGFLLYKELQDTNITIEYFIDQTAYEYSSNIEGIPVIKKEELDKLGVLDVIIVTPIHVYESIKRELEGIGVTVPIISLKKLIIEAK